jgi:hypothetical protein
MGGNGGGLPAGLLEIIRNRTTQGSGWPGWEYRKKRISREKWDIPRPPNTFQGKYFSYLSALLSLGLYCGKDTQPGSNR